jgi:two-component system sensor histidine kinase/response regulator
MTRVLLVEDSPTQAVEVSFALESAGYSVIHVVDGASALQVLAADPVEAVVSDVVMPGMSGYDVCRGVKQARPDLPVLLMTALRDPSEIVKALECGADGFVSKEHGAEHLVGRLRRLLESRALRRTAPDSVLFLGERVEVRSEKGQILDLLVSTFEDMVNTNAALEQSRAELARKNDELVRVQRAREELTALLVHDLRSPAAGIAMTASMRLRRAELNPDEKRFWNGVLAAAESIGRMVGNLLDISRSEDGALAVKLGALDVRHVVDDVAIALSEAGRRRLVVQIADDVAAVRGDLDLLRRVLQNLLDNAIRYAPSGTEVRLEAERIGGDVEIRVRDLGPGIPPDQRDRVFEKYVRLDHGPETKTGRGLGLAFCRLALQAQGGSIRVEANEPNGSVFALRLPAA